MRFTPKQAEALAKEIKANPGKGFHVLSTTGRNRRISFDGGKKVITIGGRGKVVR